MIDPYQKNKRLRTRMAVTIFINFKNEYQDIGECP